MPLLHRCRAATGMQYALLIGLIGIVVLAAIVSLGRGVETMLSDTASSLRAGGNTGGGSGPAPGALSFTTSSIVVPMNGTAYASPPLASGGSGSVTVTVVAGTLPPGLATSGATIAGTVLGTDGATVTLQAADQGGNVISAPMTIDVRDPHWGAVTGLFRFEGGAASDLKGHGFSLSGAAAIVSTPVHVTSSSLSTNGTNSTGATSPSSGDFDFGAGDFTMEMFVRTSQTATTTLLTRSTPGAPSDSSFYLGLNYHGTGSVDLYLTNGTGTWDFHIGGGNAVDGSWHHLAWVRQGTNCRIYLDGAEVASGTLTPGYTVSSSGRVLEFAMQTGLGPYNGFIQDVRITKGVARYTGPFTPPAGAFPSD